MNISSTEIQKHMCKALALLKIISTVHWEALSFRWFTHMALKLSEKGGGSCNSAPDIFKSLWCHKILFDWVIHWGTVMQASFDILIMEK